MQGERHRASFPCICTPLRSLLICPRGQQCVFDQAPGVLFVRRETIEGIDGGRMQCVHPLVRNAAHGARLRHVETVIWLLDAMRASGLCAMGARLRPGSSCSLRGWLCTEPFGRQLRLGPAGNIACHRWWEMRLTVLN